MQTVVRLGMAVAHTACQQGGPHDCALPLASHFVRQMQEKNELHHGYSSDKLTFVVMLPDGIQLCITDTPCMKGCPPASDDPALVWTLHDGLLVASTLLLAGRILVQPLIPFVCSSPVGIMRLVPRRVARPSAPVFLSSSLLLSGSIPVIPLSAVKPC